MGSGVVIGPDLVVTVGYLLIEAESVDLIDRQGRRIPGQVRAVDYAQRPGPHPRPGAAAPGLGPPGGL